MEQQPEAAANERRDRPLARLPHPTRSFSRSRSRSPSGRDDEPVAAGPSLLRADQAEPRYTEALQTAVAACAADTEGQTCYICMDGNDEEGLVRGCSCRGASGFAHVSCLARQAKILVEEAEERDLPMGDEAWNARWDRWNRCGLCEQQYHGVVACALGWACWKTYVGRPEGSEGDWARTMAMGQLGLGLLQAKQYEDALSVQEAELATFRRLDDSEDNCTLTVQSNLASTYDALGRYQDALRMSRDVYSATLKLNGKEDHDSLLEANNYARSLCKSKHFEEAKVLLRKTMPIARRFLGESHKTTLRMRWTYVMSLYNNTGATLDDVREAVTTLEDTERIARRVLGGAHPLTVGVGESLRVTRAGLRARETPPRRRRVKTQARMATRGIWQPK